jgi:predicted RNA-binding Zn-ribbon protein involved in translation (DUF1610 family)
MNNGANLVPLFISKKEAFPIFYGKRNNDDKEEVILVDTDIYSCSDGSCNGWMRKDFASEDLNCPMCGNKMVEEVRELPKM